MQIFFLKTRVCFFFFFFISLSWIFFVNFFYEKKKEIKINQNWTWTTFCSLHSLTLKYIRGASLKEHHRMDRYCIRFALVIVYTLVALALCVGFFFFCSIRVVFFCAPLQKKLSRHLKVKSHTFRLLASHIYRQTFVAKTGYGQSVRASATIAIDY